MSFFTKVYAQSADTVAKSTIPFQIPGATTPTPFVTGVSGTPTAPVPIIYLEASTNQLKTNAIATVKIHINTAQQNIKTFKFLIKYDPAYFQIIDGYPDIPNIQILFNDTFFTNDINEVDTTAGTISMNASSDQGTTQISGRAVAEFNIRSLKEGFSQIALQIEDSSLLDSNNTDILKSTGTPLDFIISDNVAITATPTVMVPSPTGTLPRNGFFDEFGAANALISGTILITIGAYLYKQQRHAKTKV